MNDRTDNVRRLRHLVEIIKEAADEIETLQVVAQASSQLVEFEDLCRKTRVSQRFMKEQIREGRIPFKQAGSRKIYNLDAVRGALAELAREPHHNIPLPPSPLNRQ